MEYNYLPQSYGADADHRCEYCHMPHKPTTQPVPDVPQVRARRTVNASELADGRGQAFSTGRLAVEHGWNVEPLHYVDADGVQWSVLRMRHPERRRVIFVDWHKPDPHGPWAAKDAFTYKPNVPDTAKVITVTQARKLLIEEPK